MQDASKENWKDFPVTYCSTIILWSQLVTWLCSKLYGSLIQFSYRWFHCWQIKNCPLTLILPFVSAMSCGCGCHRILSSMQCLCCICFYSSFWSVSSLFKLFPNESYHHILPMFMYYFRTLIIFAKLNCYTEYESLCLLKKIVWQNQPTFLEWCFDERSTNTVEMSFSYRNILLLLFIVAEEA